MKAYAKDQQQSTGEERVERKADHDDQIHEPCTLHPTPTELWAHSPEAGSARERVPGYQRERGYQATKGMEGWSDGQRE